MERELLVKYLYYLADQANALVKKDEVEEEVVANLKRELNNFKVRLQNTSTGYPTIDQAIASLEVNAKGAENDENWFWLMIKLLFGRGVLWKAFTVKRQEKVKKSLTDFRNKVSHIQFALEMNAGGVFLKKSSAENSPAL